MWQKSHGATKGCSHCTNDSWLNTKSNLIDKAEQAEFSSSNTDKIIYSVSLCVFFIILEKST